MKNWRENKGSITLFVLVAILFFVFILMGIYVSITNKQRASEVLNRKNLNQYEQDVNNIDEIYDSMLRSS